MTHTIVTPSLQGAPPAPPARPAARTRMLLDAPIFLTLLRLATPNVLNLLALAGMITFDALFLGRLGADALAGVSLAFPFVMLMQHATNSGMGGGVSSAIARALGAGRRERADALAHHAFVLALALAALFSASMFFGGAVPVSLDGRTRRDAVGGTRLFERRVRRRRIDLHVEPARQRGARYRQYELARRCPGRQRDRACSRLPGFDLRGGRCPRWVLPARAGGW